VTDPTGFDQQVVFLPTTDLERADRFYQGQLGLKLVLNQGVCRIYRTGPHAYLGVCEHLAEGAGDPRVIVTLVADDVDGWYERLTEAGVVFEAPPARNDRFGIYHAFMRDPDGNLLEIQRFEDAAWPRI
jgi:catechol 2,3-dioxygenase-like lactoylglutathione lyase family enzyme